MMRQKRRILNIRMGGGSMSENNAVRLPEVIVFAGPNGSGKSTIPHIQEAKRQILSLGKSILE